MLSMGLCEPARWPKSRVLDSSITARQQLSRHFVKLTSWITKLLTNAIVMMEKMRNCEEALLMRILRLSIS